MHVVHGVGWYYPDGVGGTERYVAGLCTALGRLDVDSTIVAPSVNDATYEHRGIKVHRYAVDPTPPRRELRKDLAPERFTALLRAQRADVFHQHSVTRGMNASCLTEARSLGLRTVHTMHTATPHCLRGTLVRPAGESCDGQIRIGRCARCWLDARRKSPVWSYVPATIGATALAVSPGARLATALGTRSAVTQHRESLRGLLADADRTVVGSRWQREMLLRNGADADAIRIVEPGLDDEFVVPSGLGPEGPAKVLFVGRVEPMKGLQVLTAAMRQLRSRAVAELEVLAVLPPEGSPHLEFARAQLAEARDMGATVIEAPGQREVAYRMARSDIVAIPSQVLETGPLVALEAMAAGAWVVASALGGLLERVHAGVGALVDHGSIDAWRDALDAAIVAAPARRASRAPAPVRHAGDVAAEMARIYNELS